MEEMGVTATGAKSGATSKRSGAPRDLRDWMRQIEAMGQLKRITEEVDWKEEMAAITYMAHQEIGAPTLHFERIRGARPGFTALWNMIGSSNDRYALSIGEPAGLSVTELILRTRTNFAKMIPPVFVEAKDAPVNAHNMVGSEVDLSVFPAGHLWPRDGGRYIGTACAVITRDPDGGWLNVGTYRQMIHDKSHVGLYVSPGKDARQHIERYWQRNQPCEVVACYGIDPATFLASSQAFPNNVSELDVIGGMMGQPMELVKGQAGSVPYPARAEIVIEGVVRPNSMKLEGPFGEFTGYYGRPEDLTYLLDIKAVHYRDKPILTTTLYGDYPANDASLFYSVARAARIWDDLDRLGIPGIKGVYCHPAAALGCAMTVISIEQRYAGHAAQVLALAGQCPGGSYFSKWIIVVDDDVDPTDTNQVIWAMATRSNPIDDVDFQRNTWATWLDPAQNPPEKRPYGSKALINACMDHRHLKAFSKRTLVRRSVYEGVAARWSTLGFKGKPPKLRALEDS